MTVYKDVVILDPSKVLYVNINLKGVDFNNGVYVARHGDQEVLGLARNIRESDGVLLADLDIKDKDFKFDPNSLSVYCNRLSFSGDKTRVNSCMLRAIYVWEAPEVVF